MKKVRQEEWKMKRGFVTTYSGSCLALDIIIEFVPLNRRGKAAACEPQSSCSTVVMLARLSVTSSPGPNVQPSTIFPVCPFLVLCA